MEKLNIDLAALLAFILAIMGAIGAFIKTKSEKNKSDSERESLFVTTARDLITAQNEKIDDLQEEVKDLETKYESLKTRLEHLEEENKILIYERDDKDAGIAILSSQVRSLGENPLYPIKKRE